VQTRVPKGRPPNLKRALSAVAKVALHLQGDIALDAASLSSELAVLRALVGAFTEESSDASPTP